MNFEKGHIYHIYNQGNNSQKIFFERENYLFFLKKVKTHILPYANILAWCLMPNHFHLMIRVNDLVATRGATKSHTPSTVETLGTQSSVPNKNNTSTLNKSIGILLASYTRAINKQNNTTGTLFRQKTKAECITNCDKITPSFYNTKAGTQIHITKPEEPYPQICFNYIHQNPVKAKLVKNSSDWEFSSALDYAGLRNGTLINKIVTEQYIEL